MYKALLAVFRVLGTCVRIFCKVESLPRKECIQGYSVVLVLLSLDVVFQVHLDLWIHLGTDILQEEASNNGKATKANRSKGNGPVTSR